MSVADRLLRRLRRRVLLREILAARGATPERLAQCDREISDVRSQLAAVVASAAAG